MSAEQTVEALKMAYRKHTLGQEVIGWDELSDKLCDALCEELGDKGFQDWLGLISHSMTDID